MISPDNYLHVKEKYEIRLNKMIEYADSDGHCRSVYLLDYFVKNQTGVESAMFAEKGMSWN